MRHADGEAVILETPRKIVFSRKGFDASAGGFPSPIFPDGTIFAVPIPGNEKERYSYADLSYEYQGDSIQSILNDLTGKTIKRGGRLQECDYSASAHCCHHDPMLFSRQEFRGIALGQVNGAEAHLRKQAVGSGDIFLFYGWYRAVSKSNGVWRFEANAPHVHLVWSYMQVSETETLTTGEGERAALTRHPWLERHPHVGRKHDRENRIYLSGRYGWFLPYDEKRVLTDLVSYEGRSTWRLPAIFNQPGAFSYLKNFISDQDSVVIRFRGYGQEFVLDLDKVQADGPRNELLDHVRAMIA